MDTGQSKLFRQVSCLSKAERKEAKEYLMASLNKKQAPEIRLFDLMVQTLSQVEDKAPDNKDLFKLLFPNEKGYDDHQDKRLRNHKSKLSKLLEQFLLRQEFEADPVLKQKLLVKAYQRRSAGGLFFKEAEKHIAQLQANNNRGSDYFMEMAWVQHALYFYPDTPKTEPNQKDFQDAILSLEVAFSLSMLSWEVEGMARKRVLNETTGAAHFLKNALQFAQECPPDEYPVVNMFLQLIQHPVTADMGALRQLVFGSQPMLNEFERSLAFKVLVNYTIASANQGGRPAQEALFSLYKAGLESGMLHRNGAIDIPRFLNITITGAAAGEFEWTEHFIKQHKNTLDPKLREKAVLLGEAYLYYFRAMKMPHRDADLGKATKCLVKIKSAGGVIELQARPLHLRVLYETANAGDFPEKMNEMLDQANYFAAFLRREEALSKDMKTGYLNFLAFFKELVGLRGSLKETRQRLIRFSEKLNLAENVRLKPWLQEKAAEL